MRDNGYPCWLYTAKGSHYFNDEAEHEAFEGDLYESPADVPAAQVEREALMARAQAAGVVVDGRWKTKRLEDEVVKAEADKLEKKPEGA